MSISISNYIRIIMSGDLNKDNYLPYLRSIWSNLTLHEKINVIKAIIYLRSPRIGLGKEEKGLYAYKAIISLDVDLAVRYLRVYIKYSSWKDLNYLLNTPILNDIIDLWMTQLLLDKRSENPSYAAKWIPSEKSTLDVIYKLWAKITNKMGIDRKTLRKNYISPLRAKLDIVESYVTSGNFDMIDYKKVPKRARNKYHETFMKHDQDRYLEYLSTTSWLWLPSSYWDTSQLPDNGIIGIDEEKKHKILIVIDNSPTTDKVSRNIMLSLTRKLCRKYHTDISPFTETFNPVSIEDPGYLNKILENMTSTLSCSLNDEEYDRIIVLTSAMTHVSVSSEKVIWWAIHHQPPVFTEINKVSYIKGYSLGLFNVLVDKFLKFNKETYYSKVLESIEIT